MTSTGFSESDLGRKAAGHQNATQSRKVPMFMASSDLDEMREHPHLGYGSNPAKSEKQARFMRACAHGADMQKKCPSKSVAREFMHTALLFGSLLLVSCDLIENATEEQAREGGRAVGGVVGGVVGGPAGAGLGETIGEIAGYAAFGILLSLGVIKGVKKAKAAKAAKK